MNQFVDVSKVIGMKQTLKAVKEEKALKVVLAEDTDESIKKSIVDCCNDHNVPIERVETKVGLGKAGGIDRGAAVIAIIK
ncbi:50S ribosomal protein L7 [Acetobacterium paludosum]|uniref:50S ribosomal protein L7 n=1 Tax=Acetobacterium paludosum TaxID=52693 RepID=A0A923I194_9FIRM|nr:ribosomal L7Ae/L30e/S12e/Gadd45 family protein [Acetobacterium paludosum]MBC3888223.1 50S ribosomal protein L7 [Acetobacterium paludosum]